MIDYLQPNYQVTAYTLANRYQFVKAGGSPPAPAPPSPPCPQRLPVDELSTLSLKSEKLHLMKCKVNCQSCSCVLWCSSLLVLLLPLVARARPPFPFARFAQETLRGSGGLCSGLPHMRCVWIRPQVLARHSLAHRCAPKKGQGSGGLCSIAS